MIAGKITDTSCEFTSTTGVVAPSVAAHTGVTTAPVEMPAKIEFFGDHPVSP